MPNVFSSVAFFMKLGDKVEYRKVKKVVFVCCCSDNGCWCQNGCLNNAIGGVRKKKMKENEDEKQKNEKKLMIYIVFRK